MFYQYLLDKEQVYDLRKRASLPPTVTDKQIIIFLEKSGGLRQIGENAANNLADKAVRFFGKVRALKPNPAQGANLAERIAYRAGQGVGATEVGVKKLVKDPDAHTLGKVGIVSALKGGPASIGQAIKRYDIPSAAHLSNKADKLELSAVKHPDNVHVTNNYNVLGAMNAGAGFSSDLAKTAPALNSNKKYVAFTGSKSKGESLLHELGHTRDFEAIGGGNMQEFNNKAKARQGGFFSRLVNPKATSQYKTEEAAWDHAHNIAKEQGLQINPDSQKHALRTYSLKGYADRLQGANVLTYPAGVHLQNKWFPGSLSQTEQLGVNFVKNPVQTTKDVGNQTKEFIQSKNPFKRQQ